MEVNFDIFSGLTMDEWLEEDEKKDVTFVVNFGWRRRTRGQAEKQTVARSMRSRCTAEQKA